MSRKNVFIASTSEDLRPYRDAAREVILACDAYPVMMEYFLADGTQQIVQRCVYEVEKSDIVIGILGWRRGHIPTGDHGGDGKTPVVEWEIRSALEKKPVILCMADRSWPVKLWERSEAAKTYLENLRAEWNPVTTFEFSNESNPMPAFCAKLKSALTAALHHSPSSAVQLGAAHNDGPPRARLHGPIVPTSLPDRPYPLLLPYTDPRTFGGRSEDVADLARRLQLHQSVLGVYAPSGAGKSSLLVAGLLPTLRQEGFAVAYDRDPTQPQLWKRLLAGLFAEVDPSWLTEEARAVKEALVTVHQRTGRPSVLILDQVEELLRTGGAQRARRDVGRLLAICCQADGRIGGPLCRWVLAYRQEFHGEVIRWLEQVIDSNDAECVELPFQLNKPDRFSSVRVPLLGQRSAPVERRLETAQRCFLEAIETPLRLVDPSTGQPHYPWQFVGDGAKRLANTFAEARLDNPDAPLTPELQVVLGYLMERARAAGRWELDVAETTDSETVTSALRDHVLRGVKWAFSDGTDRDTGRRRATALLALQELSHEGKRRVEGVETSVLERILGPGGKDVLSRLAQPDVRLVMEQEGPDGVRWVLPHDRLALVIREIAEDPAIQTQWGIDPKVFELTRLVVTQTELWKMGEKQAILSAKRVRELRQYQDTLCLEGDRKQWWEISEKRFVRARATRWGWGVVTLALIVTAVWGISAWTQKQDREQWLENVRSGSPGQVVEALDALAFTHGYSTTELQRALGIKDAEFLMKLFMNGPTGAADADRPRAVVTTARAALPSLAEVVRPRTEAAEQRVKMDDLEVFGAAVAALDYYAIGTPGIAEQAHQVRDQILAPLWAIAPKPTEEQMKEWKIEWIRVPQEGNRVTFVMGSPDDDAAALSDERPTHTVKLSPYEMMSTEVTVDHVKQLVSDYAPRFDEQGLPAHDIHWYQAYAAAAWLGGRLPTEAEWECAARAGTSTAYWFEDARHTDELKDVPCEVEGSENWTPTEQTLCKTAWFDKNAGGSLQQVRTRHPNPWGFYDLYGSVYEWTTDGYESYSKDEVVDPKGSEAGSGRVFRGGGVAFSAVWARSAVRFFFVPRFRFPDLGFRVVRSAPARP